MFGVKLLAQVWKWTIFSWCCTRLPRSMQQCCAETCALVNSISNTQRFATHRNRVAKRANGRAGFLRFWLIHLHFRVSMVISIFSCLVLCHNYSFKIFLGDQFLRLVGEGARVWGWSSSPGLRSIKQNRWNELYRYKFTVLEPSCDSVLFYSLSASLRPAC